MRDYYARNRTKQQNYQKNRAAEQRRALAQLKAERGCRDCPEKDARVLQFHHRDESAKRFTIGSRPGRLGMPALLAEVEKCDVLCANCHIRQHVDPYF